MTDNNNQIQKWEEKLAKDKSKKKKKDLPEMKVSGRQNIKLKKIMTRKGNK